MTNLQQLHEEISSEVEFIQTICIDNNGIGRGKTFPVSKLTDLLNGTEEIVGIVALLGTKSEIPFSITDLSDGGFQNTYLVPDAKSLQISPWSDDNSMAFVFYDTYDMSSRSPTPFNPRLLVREKLKELEDYGYKLLIGVENEFRLFNKSDQKPIFNEMQFDGHTLARKTLLPYIRKLNDKLLSKDIEMECWYMEYGIGQIEIPMKPYLGLEGIDKIWMFRELSKSVAEDMGMIASYMTTSLANNSSSGLHINHSLLRTVDMVNAMQSAAYDGTLSEVGENWLAGLIKHTAALTAFTSPTVNCYRRIMAGGFVATLSSWDYFRRDVAYRVKANSSMGNLNYIENRTPSSSCNIYLAIAAMIVAGLDGIKNELKLIKPRNGDHCESLPDTLEKALDALRNDSVMKDGLGEIFVDWYIKIKTECDINVLKNVDLTINTEDGLKAERFKYFIT